MGTPAPALEVQPALVKYTLPCTELRFPLAASVLAGSVSEGTEGSENKPFSN